MSRMVVTEAHLAVPMATTSLICQIWLSRETASGFSSHAPFWIYGEQHFISQTLHSCGIRKHFYGPLTRCAELRVAHAPGMPGTFSPPSRVGDPDMQHGTCVTHVPWCMPGSLTSGFLLIRGLGKCSRHSRRMRNPQFCVFGKRPVVCIFILAWSSSSHSNICQCNPNLIVTRSSRILYLRKTVEEY